MDSKELRELIKECLKKIKDLQNIPEEIFEKTERKDF
jgi:hypothetical protein